MISLGAPDIDVTFWPPTRRTAILPEPEEMSLNMKYFYKYILKLDLLKERKKIEGQLWKSRLRITNFTKVNRSETLY